MQLITTGSCYVSLQILSAFLDGSDCSLNILKAQIIRQNHERSHGKGQPGGWVDSVDGQFETQKTLKRHEASQVPSRATSTGHSKGAKAVPSAF